MHLTRVLRLAPGASVRVFNGDGGEWRAEVAEVARDRVAVALREMVTPAAEAGVRITLALAVLKGDKMDEAVRDAVMLGVGRIQPLVSERTEISAATLDRARKAERWQRIAVASAKQCGRAVVPAVLPARPLHEWLGTDEARGSLMFVEPRAAVEPRRLRELARQNAATLLVGPEGGWADVELRRAEQAGVSFVTMGDITLRADAMPLVALTAVRIFWEDL